MSRERERWKMVPEFGECSMFSASRGAISSSLRVAVPDYKLVVSNLLIGYD
jgi:hypothetical protein